LCWELQIEAQLRVDARRSRDSNAINQSGVVAAYSHSRALVISPASTAQSAASLGLRDFSRDRISKKAYAVAPGTNINEYYRDIADLRFTK